MPTDPETSSQRANRPWYLNPYKFLDDDDLMTANPRHAAFVFFHDLLVNRPTEFQALFGLFLAASNHFNFTHAQQQAARYAVEAMGQGENPAQYIAHQRGVTVSSAYRMLKRIDKKAKMVTFPSSVAVHSDADDLLAWEPTRQQIRQRAYNTPHECPGHGTPQCEGTAPGRFDLCYSCYRTYGLRGEWDQWLLVEVRANKNRRYEEALQSLYREYHAGIIQPVALRRTA